MNTTEYCNKIESDCSDGVFSTLTFYETNRFKRNLRTGAFLSAGPEDRAFVAFIADATGAVRANTECRLLQPEALPGELEAYGKSVIQIECVCEEPKYAADGAAEVLISALPGVVKDLYGVECHTIIFLPVPEVHTDMSGEPDFLVERFVSRIGRLGKYRVVPGDFMMFENVKAPAIVALFAGYSGAYRPEEDIKGTCGREMI